MKANSILKIAGMMALAIAFTGTAKSTMARQEKGEQASTESSHSMTVTGCLQKGDEAGEYSITDSGKTYGLRSKSVDLSKHVGHKVSVTGTMKPESSEAGESAEANKGTKAKEAKEAGDISVDDLKMISASCQQ
jgi:hypothetical protein